VEGSEYFTGADLYVGACVNFNGHKFILFDADEYAYSYMEQNPGEVSLRGRLTIIIAIPL
jgi:hypothetical protein